MKKILALTMCALALTGVCAYAENDGVTVMVNGTKVEFDSPAEIINNRVMVPVRAVAEALSQEVRYYENTKTVGFSDKGLDKDTTLLKIGSDEVLTLDVSSVAKVEKTDAAPLIKNNRTLVPLRAISEALDCDVNWDEKTRTVTVESKLTDGFKISGEFRRYGVIDKDSNLIIPRKYESIEYKNGHFICYSVSYVGQSWQYDIYDKTGKEVLSCKSASKVAGYLFLKDTDGKYFVLSPEGEFVLSGASKEDFTKFKIDTLKMDVDGYSDNENGTAPVLAWKEGEKRGDTTEESSLFRAYALYGYISPEHDKIVIDLKYDDATDFYNGYAEVKENGKWKVINEKGEQVANKEYDFKPEVHGDYIVYEVYSENGDRKYGADDLEGKQVLAPEYSEISTLVDIAIVEKDGKCGIINLDGTIILPFEYKELLFMNNGLICAKKDGKYGFIDKDGKVEIPFEYDYLYLNDNSKVYAEKNGKKGFIDQSGNVIIPIEYDYVQPLSDNRFIVGKNSTDDEETNDLAIINEKGEEIAQIGKKGRNAYLAVKNGFVQISIDGQLAFVNGDGEVFEASTMIWP